MRYAVLDGSSVRSRRQLHSALQRALELPVWYGRNLDALHDCLTDLGEEELTLVVEHAGALDDMGGYGEAFLRVLRDCREENPRFHLVLQEE